MRFRRNLLTRHRVARIGGILLGVLLNLALGWLLLAPLLGDGLSRFSYDLPLTLQNRVPEEVVMVYFDPAVKRRLDQPTDLPLNRRFHAQLVDRLRTDGAKLVVFDILFEDPAAEPAVDAEFARAMRECGRVVLAAEDVKHRQATVMADSLIPPTPQLAESSLAVGLGNVDDDPRDGAVRRLYPGLETMPSLSLAAAGAVLGPGSARSLDRLESRYLNYYCAPAKLEAINLDHALQADGLPPGYFRDKLVVVGARPESLTSRRQPETFGNPYSRLGGVVSPGAAVHAISLVNLLRGDWLSRLSQRRELGVVVVWGIAISLLLLRLSPWVATGTALVCELAFSLAAGWVQLRHHVWFAWAVPAGAQTSFALVWAVGYRYLLEYRRRERLRRAFSVYTSPQMAERIANSDIDLAPGGREVEATIAFTDLEGFTKLSEGLSPMAVSKILNAYFNQTTRVIMDLDGMVIKFIGDGVFAAWGAPMPDPNPAERAVTAAWTLQHKGPFKIEGRLLRTRIGINSGTVLAGNLGSDLRFDYTLIGDAINLAARLETLNRQLGTQLLISATTRARLGPRFRVRDLGQFVVAGKSEPVGVFEVLGVDAAPGATAPEPWQATFAEALSRFVAGDFDRATEKFQEVSEQRGGQDGPSRFYSRHIDHAQSVPRAGAWDGVVRLAEK
jgi:adenylate cyclase